MGTSFIGQSSLPIGLRNNNPGDLKTGIAWQGMTGSEGAFITFQDITWGLRALARDLVTKISSDGLDTITAIVTKFAPASDSNDVPAYIAAVSADTGLNPGEQLGTDPDTLHSLMRAIIRHELGDSNAALVQDSDIDAGIQMATGQVSTLEDAAAIAVQNPAPYVESVSPLTWAAIAVGVVGLGYYFSRKN